MRGVEGSWKDTISRRSTNHRRGVVMSKDGVGELNREQLEQLVSYFDEAVISSRNYKTP
jgi:hypothetical protein